jgi:hypothetical protein
MLSPPMPRGKQLVEEALHAQQLTADVFRIDQPTLENTFVATLRASTKAKASRPSIPASICTGI